jgi:hypothetical protein
MDAEEGISKGRGKKEEKLMTNVTKDKIGEFVVSGEFDIAASVKADRDSLESKSVTLRFVMDSVPLSDIIASSLKDKRINWQTTARSKFSSISNKSIVRVDYKGGRSTIASKEQVVNFANSLSPEERAKLIADLQAMMK